MLQFLLNMSIVRRLLIAAALTALIPGIVISILGGSYIGTLNTINDTVQAGNNAVKLATDMQADLLRMNALLAALNTTSISSPDNVQNSSEIGQLTSDFSSTLGIYQQSYQITTSTLMKSVRNTLDSDNLGNQAPVSQHSMIFVVDIQWQLYNGSQHQALLDVQHNSHGDVLAGDIAQANLEYLPLKGNLDNLVGLTESISQVVAQVNTLQINPILFWTIFAVLFSTLIVFAISYIINLTITRPLHQLVSLTRRIARGETDARANVKGHDEIYMVATSMNAMLDSIGRLVLNIQNQRDLLESGVDKLVAEVKGLGSGDLRTRAQVTADALGFLARSFNYMIDELSNLVIRVKQVTHEVEVLTSTTQLRMMQLVEVSEHQIQDMSSVVTAMERMADSTFTVAERSQVLATIARETHQAARTGREAVERTGDGMQRIHQNVRATADKFQVLGESSQQINSIVAVIANFAHQTNRLALDANIQAAMAGANGKGFAAIATDIRRLAEQTKDQAQLIAVLVRTVNENIGNVAQAMRETERETADGTELAQQAGHALDSIFDEIERQTQAIDGINTGLNQHLHLSRSVLQIVQNAAEANRRSSNSTREATYTMSTLSQLVERLRASVGAFKLPEEHRIYQTKPLHHGRN